MNPTQIGQVKKEEKKPPTAVGIKEEDKGNVNLANGEGIKGEDEDEAGPSGLIPTTNGWNIQEDEKPQLEVKKEEDMKEEDYLEEEEEESDVTLDASGQSSDNPEELYAEPGQDILQNAPAAILATPMPATPIRLNVNILKFYKNKPPQLTDEQKLIFNYVDDLISDVRFRKNNPRLILLEGPVGSGKTEIMKYICKYLVKTWGKKTGKFISKNAIFAASTGVAALNYEKGQTAHGTFNFPLTLMEGVNDRCNLSEWNRNQLKEASIIVYDEISMVDNRYITMLDECLKTIMKNKTPFGGKIIVFVGDYRLLAPVVEWAQMGNKEVIIDRSTVSLPTWDQAKRFTLSSVQRTAGDQRYSDFLMKLGTGQLPSLGQLNNVSDSNFIALTNIRYTTILNDIIDYVYPKDDLPKPDLCTKRAILVPRRKEAKAINDHIIQNYLDGDVIHCISEETEETKRYLTEYEALLDSLEDDKEFPDQDLKLKKGCLCMIIMSMHKPTKLLTGTKVIFERISGDGEKIYVRLPGKSAPTTTVYELQKKWFEVSFRPRYRERLVLRRKQFPLRVGYATTIHKCQGQTLTKVAVDLRVPYPSNTAVFRHGQLLQALSRVKSTRNIKVLVDERDIRGDTAHTYNIVHPELVARYIGNGNAVPMDIE